MTSGDFGREHAARWAEAEELLRQLEGGKKPVDGASFPKRFREIGGDLALARRRMYGSAITERLNDLVIRGHAVMDRSRRSGWRSFVEFVTGGFPRAVRSEWRLFWLCNAAFWIPFLGMLWIAGHDMRWVQAVIGAEGMSNMEDMYGGRSQQIAHLRSEYGSNFMMFCFYIYNNVAIDFRVFAGGILAGLGTMFFIVFNGLHIGASAGYANHACDPQSFWTFVAGHSSYELLGMVVAGMAGLRMGSAILNPGRLPRVRALGMATKQALPLIYGAALMTTVAAVIEGFWSARDFEPWLKYSVGLTGWILCAAYLGLVGRRRNDEA